MKFDYCTDEMILKVYPTASACFEEAFSLMKKNFWILVLIVFMRWAIEAPIWFMGLGGRSSDTYQLTFSIFELIEISYYFAVGAVFSYGIALVFLKTVRKETLVFEDVLLGFKNYSRVVLSNLVTVLIIVLGFFLVIPGIFFACRLIFVPYLIMDKKHGVVKSIKLSYYMTKGYFWTIFSMAILSFGIIILGLVLLGFGILISFVWINAAFAVLYNAAEDLHYIDACKEVGLVPEEKEEV